LNKIEGDEGVEGVGVEGCQVATEVQRVEGVRRAFRIVGRVGRGRRASREPKGIERVEGSEGSQRVPRELNLNESIRSRRVRWGEEAREEVFVHHLRIGQAGSRNGWRKVGVRESEEEWYCSSPQPSRGTPLTPQTFFALTCSASPTSLTCSSTTSDTAAV
jgi:hypothetical protein